MPASDIPLMPQVGDKVTKPRSESILEITHVSKDGTVVDLHVPGTNLEWYQSPVFFHLAGYLNTCLTCKSIPFPRNISLSRFTVPLLPGPLNRRQWGWIGFQSYDRLLESDTE
jgi:hypothetical protein